jgi:tetrahydromethanopterin S-methyltransferase subunit E
MVTKGGTSVDDAATMSLRTSYLYQWALCIFLPLTVLALIFGASVEANMGDLASIVYWGADYQTNSVNLQHIEAVFGRIAGSAMIFLVTVVGLAVSAIIGVVKDFPRIM